MSSLCIQPGLVSVTFRKLSPEAILDLMVQAGQCAVEWGGDVHVPPGDTTTAAAVARRCGDAGIACVNYGSYYRAGETEGNPDFEAVRDSALALGVQAVRVWAGKKGSAEAPPAYRTAVTGDLQRICALAEASGLRIALEYHGNTLTDEPHSALQLIRGVGSPVLDSLWQPTNGASKETCLETIRLLKPAVSHLHVFHWGKGWGDRYPLAEGADRWLTYLREFANAGFPRWALMEFVPGDDPEAYLRDARTLADWLRQLETEFQKACP